MPPLRCDARSASVTAKTMQNSACGLLVVQILLPLRRQPLPSAVARVLMRAASDPAPGSERPKHMLVLPAIISGKISRLASSVIFSSTGLGPIAQWLTA